MPDDDEADGDFGENDDNDDDDENDEYDDDANLLKCVE